MARRKTYGFSFSWRRATGLSAAKGRLSRKLGIPLTRAGRQRKAGKLMGCAVIVFAPMIGAGGLVAAWVAAR